MAISSYKWSVAKKCAIAQCLLPLVLLGSLPGRSYQSVTTRHPFYISVTEINHNAKDKTLEISCKLFTNDLEAVLQKERSIRLDLSSPADKKICDGYIAAYVEKNLQIQVDGKPVQLRFVGSEKEQDATWCYFQAEGVAVVKRMEIMNSLLYEGFDQEINIMHVLVGGDRRSGKLAISG